MERTMFYKASPLIFEMARELRSQQTHAETILWEYLKTKPSGYKFRRQHPLGIFILDFYCHEIKLCIEVDGEYHYQSDQIVYDQERTNLITASGLKLIRFDNSRVLNNIEAVVSEIKETIINLKANIPLTD